MKKSLRFFTVVFIAVIMLSASAYAWWNGPADPNDYEFTSEYMTDDGFGYDVVDGEAVLKGYIGTLTELTVPDNLDGYPLTVVGDGAFYNSKLTSLTLPESVVKIGDMALAYSSSLRTVYLPDSVETFGHSVMAHCGLLRTVRFPEGIKTIPAGMFQCSTGSADIIPYGVETIEGYAFDQWLSDKIIIPDSVRVMSGRNFTESSVSKVTMSANIEEVNDNILLFDSRYWWDSSNWENGLLYVGPVISYSKLTYKTITDAYIRPGTRVLATYALTSATEIENLHIPDSVITIPGGCFPYSNSGNETRLKSISVDENNPKYCSVDGVLYSKDMTVIIKYPACKEGEEFIIPETVREISTECFRGCVNLKTVTIPEGVTSIPDSAFYSSSVECVNIPESVTSIGNRAFCKCKNLRTVGNTAGFTNIGSYAFYECSALENFTLSEGMTKVEAYAFYNCSATDINVNCRLTDVGNYAFYNCRGLNVETLEFGTEASVGSYAFYYCEKIKSLTIDCEFKESAFDLCKGLETVVIGDSVTSIPRSAFSCCSALTNITLGANITEIGIGAFSSCSSITRFELPDGLSTIKHGTFGGCTSLSEITIPDSVTSIGRLAFSRCSSLTNITIPASVTSLGESVFEGCTGIEEIVIPDSVTTIEKYAFSGCSALRSIDIPDSVTSLGDYVFYNCTGLVSAKIGDGIVKVPSYAFLDCKMLSDVQLPSGLLKIYEKSFSGCTALQKIDIPDSVRYIAPRAFYCDANLRRVKIPNGVTTIENGTFYCCSNLTIVELPDSVETIGQQAFQGCHALSSINLDKVKNIGTNAFRSAFQNGISGKTVLWLDAVETIGEYAFGGCCADSLIITSDNLQLIDSNAFYVGKFSKVYIKGSGSTEITGAFSNLSSLESVVLDEGVDKLGNSALIGCKELTQIALPENLTTLEKSAIAACYYLKTAYLPSGLSVIDTAVFSSCGSLETIYYAGTEAQWNSAVVRTLSASSSADKGFLNAEKVFNHRHTAGEWETFIEATQFNKGVRIRKCVECGKAVETEILPCLTGVGPVLLESWDISSDNSGSIYAHIYTDPDYEGCYRLFISGSGTMKNWDSADELPWNAAYASRITNLTISNGIVNIGSNMTVSCTLLTNVYFEEGENDWDNVVIGEGNEPIENISVGAVKPHVHNNSRGSGQCTECGEYIDKIAKLSHRTISLSGDIAVNFYVEMSQALTEADLDGIYMKFVLSDGTESVMSYRDAVSKTNGGVTYRMFTCRVHATQMTQTITATMYNGEREGTSYEYSVKQYCDGVYDSVGGKVKDVIDAMRVYGAASQIYFDKDVDNLVTDMSGVSIPEPGDLSEYGHVYTLVNDSLGIRGRYISLVLFSETAIRVYFDLDAGCAMSDYEFIVTDENGREVSYKIDETKKYLDILNIGSTKLDEMFNVTVKKNGVTALTIKYGAFSYVKTMINESDPKLVNVVKALYAYNKAAEAYVQ